MVHLARQLANDAWSATRRGHAVTADGALDAAHSPDFGAHDDDAAWHAVGHQTTLVQACSQTTHHARQAEIRADT